MNENACLSVHLLEHVGTCWNKAYKNPNPLSIIVIIPLYFFTKFFFMLALFKYNVKIRL